MVRILLSSTRTCINYYSLFVRVGRTSTMGTRENAVRRFTYDVPGRETDGRATDDRNKGDGSATDGQNSRESG